MGSGLSSFNVFSHGTSCGPYNPFIGRRVEKIDSVTIQSASPTNLLRNESGKHNFDSHDEKEEQKPVENVKETEGDKKLHVDTQEHTKYNSDTDDDEEERRNSDFEGYIFMKSPSFRDFCIGYHSDDSVNTRFKRTATIGKIDVEKEKKPKPVEDSNLPPDIICDGEVCMRRPPKAANSSSSTENKMRRKRRSSFSKVFTHTPTGMKNLLKVKDYYTTSQPKKTPPQN